MIKIAGIANLVEGYFRMAFGTILPETIFMYIPVAAGTVAVLQFPENLEIFPVAGYCKMTFTAIYLLVLPFQREVALVVVETRSWAEIVQIVAGGTFCSKGSLVIILVA